MNPVVARQPGKATDRANQMLIVAITEHVHLHPSLIKKNSNKSIDRENSNLPESNALLDVPLDFLHRVRDRYPGR
jgi:hypothetical protein